jgi:hypothetical protein
MWQVCAQTWQRGRRAPGLLSPFKGDPCIYSIDTKPGRLSDVQTPASLPLSG